MKPDINETALKQYLYSIEAEDRREAAIAKRVEELLAGNFYGAHVLSTPTD